MAPSLALFLQEGGDVNLIKRQIVRISETHFIRLVCFVVGWQSLCIPLFFTRLWLEVCREMLQAETVLGGNSK